uniref:15-hydroxyprostaglandin dehydrogenase [NAD(+)] n=1 Tax=Dicentrarchus labrax TaxID=13489 RepID=A0A8C4F9E4_DICLA
MQVLPSQVSAFSCLSNHICLLTWGELAVGSLCESPMHVPLFTLSLCRCSISMTAVSLATYTRKQNMRAYTLVGEEWLLIVREQRKNTQMLSSRISNAFQSTVDKFGRLDIVINNAGINNEKNWEKTIQVNLTSVIKGTYLALEHMSKEYGKEGGIIINVSSMAAFLHSPHQPVYTATKHGVIGFTRAMADASSLGNYGVRINVLCPAFVDTPLLHSVEHEDNMGKFVKFKDDFKRSMSKFGVLQPSLIAEGMMRLIVDSSLNGAVMKITCSKGIHFHTYEPMSA